MSSEISYIISVDNTGAVTAIQQTSDAMQSLGDTTSSVSDGTDASMTSMGAGFGRMASSGLVAFDRIQISMNSVENAQIRQELAQQRVTDAIEKYGAGSDQARKAQEELSISTRGLEIANERLDVRMTIMGLSTIPHMIVGLKELGTSLSEYLAPAEAATAANQALATSEEEVDVASGVGIPLALAAIAIGAGVGVAGGYALAGGFGGGAGGGYSPTSVPHTPMAGPNINVYGDVNVNGSSNPADFAQGLQDQSMQTARTSNP